MGPSRFYALLSALLFAAVCAYVGAAVFRLPEPQNTRAMPALAQSEGRHLRGILLRREEKAPSQLSAAPGQRIPAGENVPETAVYFPSSDGYEYLSPADAQELTAERLDELMHAPADSYRGAKLIYGFECYFAAFYYGIDDIQPGPCRLKFQGEDFERRAELLYASSSPSKSVMLFRLLPDSEFYSLRFCTAELIYK